jgi:S-adenosylmethionine decarboxylase proenzyme
MSMLVLPPKPHLVVDYYGCSSEKLDDLEGLKAVLYEAANAIGATTIGDHFHQFSPHGVTGVIVIAESHISVHTWVEEGYAAIDLFMCNSKLTTERVEHAVNLIGSFLEASHSTLNAIQRGAAQCTMLSGTSPTSATSTARVDSSI